MYLHRLDRLFQDAIRLLNLGEIGECQNRLDSPYSLDDEIAIHQPDDPDSFEQSIQKVAGDDNLEAAFSLLVSDEVVRKECQLELLKGIVALRKLIESPSLDLLEISWKDAYS